MKKLAIIMAIISISNINILKGKMTEEILETQIKSKIGKKKHENIFNPEIFDIKTHIAKNNIELSSETINKKYYKKQMVNKIRNFKDTKENILSNKNFDISIEEFHNTKKEIEIMKYDDNKIKTYINNKIK
ncbi:hypothetical protein [Fusobacterium sp. PH5-44]|uniref:hypothetical protein n=1 Tax=unclassified Fusobacterium TaxID=2648384 RepID=UPI003D20A4BD